MSAVSIDNLNDAATSNSHVGILAAKVQRAVNLATDTPNLRAALAACAKTTSDRTYYDSRSVRTALEQDALHQAMLLQATLEDIGAAVSDLCEGCETVRGVLQEVHTTVHADCCSTEASTEADVAHEIAAAIERYDTTKLTYVSITNFMKQFNLNDSDKQLLETYEFSSGNNKTTQANDFLRALIRTQDIRTSLSSSDSMSNAMQLLEHISNAQNRAYQQLYEHLQTAVTVLSSSSMSALPTDVSKASATMDAHSPEYVWRALMVLRAVPAYFTHIIELVAAQRRIGITKGFLLALTTGDTETGTAPIELRAHDSTVYVGDMLAFAYKSFSVEADFACSLLDTGSNDNETNYAEALDDVVVGSITSYDSTMNKAELVAIAVSGLARPLKARIVHVIGSLSRRGGVGGNTGGDSDSEDDSEDENDDDVEEGMGIRTNLGKLYEISGLLRFYVTAVAKSADRLSSSNGDASVNAADSTISSVPNPLLSCLFECLRVAEQAYEATVRVYGSMLQELSISTAESQAGLAHKLLVTVHTVRKSSPGFGGDSDAEMTAAAASNESSTDGSATAPVYDSASIVLTIEWITETILQRVTCQSIDDVATMKQSLLQSRAGGMKKEIGDELEVTIASKETELMLHLVQQETEEVLDVCGLGDVMQAFEKWQEVAQQQEGGAFAMNMYPGLSQSDMEQAMTEFYNSLYSPPIPSLQDTIQDDARLRQRTRTAIATRVCSRYRALYETIASESYNSSFLQHTPEQVDTLFSA